jgi:hypothetical protein
VTRRAVQRSPDAALRYAKRRVAEIRLQNAVDDLFADLIEALARSRAECRKLQRENALLLRRLKFYLPTGAHKNVAR